MKQVLFGEKSIEEREGALEQRLKDRKEYIELRRQAEIARHDQQQEEGLRDND